MDLASTKAYLKKLKQERWEVFWQIKAETYAFRIDAENLLVLSRKFAELTAAIEDCESLLPKPWWKKLCLKMK